MTTDEKPDAQRAAERASRRIEIDVSDFLAGPKLSDLEILAGAHAAVIVMKEARDSNPDHLERLLGGSWKRVQARLCGLPAAGWKIQTMVLQEYFTHRGNWPLMLACLEEQGVGLEKAPGEFRAASESQLKRTRREYAAQFGGAE